MEKSNSRKNIKRNKNPNDNSSLLFFNYQINNRLNI